MVQNPSPWLQQHHHKARPHHHKAGPHHHKARPHHHKGVCLSPVWEHRRPAGVRPGAGRGRGTCVGMGPSVCIRCSRGGREVWGGFCRPCSPAWGPPGRPFWEEVGRGTSSSAEVCVYFPSVRGDGRVRGGFIVTWGCLGASLHPPHNYFFKIIIIIVVARKHSTSGASSSSSSSSSAGCWRAASGPPEAVALP